MENTTGPTVLVTPTAPTEYRREPFKIMSMKELFSTARDERNWICESLIPEGVLFILAAYPKAGKSQFSSQLAIAIAQGKDFLGFKTMQRNVLVLSIEEHPDDVSIRLKDLGALETDPISIRCDPLRQSMECIEDLKLHITEQDLGLVLIDTLGCFWNVESENDNAKVEKALEPLRTLAHQTNCAIGVIHHTNKAGGTAGKELRGASALLGAADQLLVLDSVQGMTNKRLLKITGRYKAKCPSALKLDFKDGQYISLGSKEEIKDNEIREAIQEVIRLQSCTERQIADLSGVSRAYVRKYIKGAVEQGIVKQEGKGGKKDPRRYYLIQVVGTV